jgi:folate-binding protein YgfZ
MAAKIASLPERALIRVEGPDWRPFLHNLLTNDMEGLEVGRPRFAALLTPQGRLLHDLFVLAGEDAAVLDVAAAGREALVKRLMLYRLRAKVTVEAVAGGVHAAWDGDPGQGWEPDPRLPELGWRSVTYDGPTTASPDAYDIHRLRLGVPDPARDAADSTYPIEADFDLLNGIDFKKGCFIGQETTSRMKRRGAIKTRMAPITFDGPPPPVGSEVLAGELRAGEVRSGVEGRAMALLRLDRIGGASLTVEGRPVRPALPPWLPALPSAV